MKRIFTFFFALLSACTFSAYAAIVDGTCGENLTWTLNTKDSTLTISGTGEMTNYSSSTSPWSDYKSYIKYVTLPDGLTSIGESAFFDCEGLTSVTIPNSVTSIGEWAFRSCSGLTSVTIPNSVTSIGGSAFCYCSGLTSVTLGNNITSIGDWAFDGCSKLTSVTIPNSVTSIGFRAFCDCSSLTSITIPNSVTSIGSRAFYECDNLTSITIPNSVIEMGSAMFYGCDNLKSVVLSENITSWPEPVWDMVEGFFEGCKSLTSITIPNSVTSIGEATFRGCFSLTSVTLGNSVTSIGYSVFSGCSALTSITIPNSVTSIGGSAFRNCSGLTSVTLGSGVTRIEYEAFDGCNQIQEVTAYMPTPPAAISCGLNQTAATLYVPAEYIGTYSNSVWWEDFKEIRALDADYVVTFLDWDGTTLATAGVAAGQAATAPADPVREGYTFIGWDSDFSCVIEDMTVTAQYQINRYQVRFYDWDDTLLKTDSVDYQSAATAPADPTREGYTFIGWDKDFSSITADLDVHAQYEAGADKDLTVVYSDRDNNEISTQTLTFRIPLAPEIEGFTFLYWQPVAAPINDMITIQAVYEATTAAPEVYVNPSNPAQKLICNGQVYILHEDKMYTISGQVVK